MHFRVSHIESSYEILVTGSKMDMTGVILIEELNVQCVLMQPSSLCMDSSGPRICDFGEKSCRYSLEAKACICMRRTKLIQLKNYPFNLFRVSFHHY